jgi:hypothetical protein
MTSRLQNIGGLFFHDIVPLICTITRTFVQRVRTTNLPLKKIKVICVLYTFTKYRLLRYLNINYDRCGVKTRSWMKSKLKIPFTTDNCQEIVWNNKSSTDDFQITK